MLEVAEPLGFLCSFKAKPLTSTPLPHGPQPLAPMALMEEVPPCFVDVQGKENRRRVAEEVVNAGINIYVAGVKGDLPLIGKWLSWLDDDEACSWDERHERIARLLYEAGVKLGGVAVKAMQFVGQRDDLHPAYIKWFSKAQQSAAVRSRADYVQAIVAQLGLGPNLSYEQEPRWSASISQVHLGNFDGRQVVVKVKHQGATDECPFRGPPL